MFDCNNWFAYCYSDYTFANKYVVDVIVAILAVSAIYEYMKCVKHKV